MPEGCRIVICRVRFVSVVPLLSCPICHREALPGARFCALDGTPLQTAGADPYLGIELPGQVVIQQALARGGTGTVYRAHQGGVDRAVAVKILHRELSANPDLVRRFHREAMLASRLSHPHLVQVLMTGTIPFGADLRVGGELYLVMDLVDGMSLRALLRAGPLPLDRSLRIVGMMAEALEDAHARGIVHRDLKPENVMIAERDWIKVIDFGIARLESPGEATTRVGAIVGTADYIAPEVACGAPVTPSADVFALGCILFECLTGQLPFPAATEMASLIKRTTTDAPDVRTLLPAVPSAVASLIADCLVRDPAGRPASAKRFLSRLVAAATDAGVPLHLSLVRPSSIPPVHAAQRPSGRASPIPTNLRNAALGMLTMAAGISLGFFLANRSSHLPRSSTLAAPQIGSVASVPAATTPSIPSAPPALGPHGSIGRTVAPAAPWRSGTREPSPVVVERPFQESPGEFPPPSASTPAGHLAPSPSPEKSDAMPDPGSPPADASVPAETSDGGGPPVVPVATAQPPSISSSSAPAASPVPATSPSPPPEPSNDEALPGHATRSEGEP